MLTSVPVPVMASLWCPSPSSETGYRDAWGPKGMPIWRTASIPAMQMIAAPASPGCQGRTGASGADVAVVEHDDIVG